MQLSQTLKISGIAKQKTVRCNQCDHAFGLQTENWKNSANVIEQTMSTLGGPYTSGEGVLLRSFNCPNCGLLLDTEIAMKDDPFLEDIIFD